MDPESYQNYKPLEIHALTSVTPNPKLVAAAGHVGYLVRLDQIHKLQSHGRHGDTVAIAVASWHSWNLKKKTLSGSANIIY